MWAWNISKEGLSVSKGTDKSVSIAHKINSFGSHPSLCLYFLILDLKDLDQKSQLSKLCSSWVDSRPQKGDDQTGSSPSSAPPLLQLEQFYFLAFLYSAELCFQKGCGHHSTRTSV